MHPFIILDSLWIFIIKINIHNVSFIQKTANSFGQFFGVYPTFIFRREVRDEVGVRKVSGDESFHSQE